MFPWEGGCAMCGVWPVSGLQLCFEVYLVMIFLNLMFMGLCIINGFFLSITNKMQRYTIFFIAVNALHMFQAVSPLIIGSSNLYTQHLVYVKLACCYR